MYKIFLFVIVLSFVFISCNPTGADLESPFNVKVQVVDSNGNPLSDMNVSLWSKLNYSSGILKISGQNEINAASTIQFNLPQQSFVSLIIYDLNDKIVDKLISNEIKMAGAYSYTWATSYYNGVFKCKLITSSDSLQNNILFKDSIYVVEISPDPRVSVIGKTDDNGIVTASDKLLFPNLFNLPSIPHTLADGPQPFGYFTFSDSIIIAVSDTSFSEYILYECAIKNGENKLSLKWDKSLPKHLSDKRSGISRFTRDNLIRNPGDVIPKDWKLYQNYPNPFN
jgi:hypothetical protein